MSHPRLLTSRAELTAWDNATPGDRAVVMTMGALHAGHLDLVAKARSLARTVIVTLFVNPLQFGPNEDFETYPRTLSDDLEALVPHEVSAVYAPRVADVYPGGRPMTRISPGRMGEVFEGEIRPGHFEGVLTVVHTLLEQTRPDIAVFGQKDAQQLALVRRMVRDLNPRVAITSVPIRRDDDGLATSSRNRFLDPRSRRAALALPDAIRAGEKVWARGGGAREVAAAALERLGRAGKEIVVDYAEVVDARTFLPLEPGGYIAEKGNPGTPKSPQPATDDDGANPATRPRPTTPRPTPDDDGANPANQPPSPPPQPATNDDGIDPLLIGAIRVGSVRLIDNAPLGRRPA